MWRRGKIVMIKPSERRGRRSRLKAMQVRRERHDGRAEQWMGAGAVLSGARIAGAAKGNEMTELETTQVVHRQHWGQYRS